ncbi:HNH nuclease [Pseudomonas mosselii]|nr:HNH nuclease [Pseudomonas mosselii]
MGITLPPINVTPDVPKVPSTPLPTFPTLPPTYEAKPLPWDGRVVSATELDNFFNQRNIKDPQLTMSVVVTIASMQRNIEQSYLAYLPGLRAEVDTEIKEALDNQNLSALSKLKLEQLTVQSMLDQSTAELSQSRTVAVAFFGRGPLDKDIKKSAVDFVNIFQSPGNPHTPLNTYKRWRESVTAAYRVNILSEKINILTEKSKSLSTALITAQAEENARLVARIEAFKVANTFPAQGSAAIVQPLFTTAAGTLAIEGEAAALVAAIRSAIASVVGMVAGTLSSTVVGVIALLAFPRELANGELPQRYTFSTPLSDLAPGVSNQMLQDASRSTGLIDLPVRLGSRMTEDGRSELFAARTDSLNVPSKIRVIAASYSTEHKVYTATTTDTPARILTWTPVVSPGNSSTTSPAEQPLPPSYTGAVVTAAGGRLDTYPALVEGGFDDYIVVYPEDSGLAPIYVMFRDRREDPGTATGAGQPVSGAWLGAALQGDGAAIPTQVADQLRGRSFKNFKDFREALWVAVATSPDLASQFDPGSLAMMRKGYAAFVKKSERVGGRIKYEVHHQTLISSGGEVYNIDNLRITTPKRHIEIHQEHNR